MAQASSFHPILSRTSNSPPTPADREAALLNDLAEFLASGCGLRPRSTPSPGPGAVDTTISIGAFAHFSPPRPR